MFLTKSLLLLVLTCVAMAFPADHYGPPKHQPSYKAAPLPYSFSYGVKDDYYGTDFGQNEVSDGTTVKGSYTVQLPDGRKQTVTYVADHYGGYRAEVTYYGQAQYAKPGPAITFKPQYHQPSYHSGPSYH